MRNEQRIASLACALGLALAGAGCGSGSNGGDAGGEPSASGSMQDETPRRAMMAGPAFDADATEVAEFLSGGQWTFRLLPEATTVADVSPPTVAADFEVGAETGQIRLAGTVAGAGVNEGTLSVSEDGATLPRVEFVTDGMTVEGLAGEAVQVPGPVRWEAELYRGRLIGTATGPDGRESAWEGFRPG